MLREHDESNVVENYLKIKIYIFMYFYVPNISSSFCHDLTYLFSFFHKNNTSRVSI